MKNIINIYSLAFSMIMLVFASCEKDFLDINDDPNNPLSVPTGQLMTAAQSNLSYTFANGSGGLGLYTGTVAKHWVQRGTINDYGLVGGDFTVATAWPSIYAGAMTDLQVLIEQGTLEEDFGTVGAGQVMRAFIMASVVDLWGEVPYFEIGLGAANEAPVYDEGEAVYNALFTLIDDGIANLSTTNASVTGDVIYNGDASSWITLANSLKLRMLNNVRLTRDVSTEVNAILTSGNFITQLSEDFELQYGSSFNPENRNPGFASEWVVNSGTRIDPFFFETMRGTDTFGHGGLLPAGAGLTDPRIPYYFFNQLPADAADSDAENPCAYCPSRSGTGFLSIFSYSFNIDPNEGFAQGRSSTLGGLYAFGGRYDDGAGGIASNAASLLGGQVTGTGSTPQRLLDGVEIAFIRAELAQTSVSSENARGMLVAALDASFAKVNEVANAAGAPLIGASDIAAYSDAVMVNYDGASPSGQLEIIMVSKWIAQFGNSVVSYNDIRRTGFPRLHDGNTDNLAVTTQTRTFPLALPYDANNLTLNVNAPAQRAIAVDGVFWDK
jgi:hypothetical protein